MQEEMEEDAAELARELVHLRCGDDAADPTIAAFSLPVDRVDVGYFLRPRSPTRRRQ